VEADVVEARRPRLAHRRARAIGAVDPAEALQLRVVERLHAKADAIDTGAAETFQLVAIDGLGVGLERDLRGRIEIDVLTNRFDDGADLRRFEQRRRAAAEKDRVGPVRAKALTHA